MDRDYYSEGFDCAIGGQSLTPELQARFLTHVVPGHEAPQYTDPKAIDFILGWCAGDHVNRQLLQEG